MKIAERLGIVTSSAPAPSAPVRQRASLQSHRGLDGMLFLLADVRDGLSPFFAMFLASARHWAPGGIGLAFAINNIASAACQIPAGMLVDITTRKRLLFAASGTLVAAGVMLIALVPHHAAVFLASAMLGVALSVFHPITIGLSLGLVRRRGLAARVSRNETFNHAGNFLAALMIGLAGYFFGLVWIFYLVAGFALSSAAMAALIRPHEIDHHAARGEALPGATALPVGEILHRRDFVVFLIVVALFFLGNGAMLPLASESLAAHHSGNVLAMSGCIMAAQMVMAFASAAAGRTIAAGHGRKPIFLLALAMLPLRGVLLMVVHAPLAVIAVQALDGVGSGIFGVVSALIAADVMQGTGRINLAQGAVALAVSLGAAASNLFGGLIAQQFGYAPAFFILGAVGVGTFLIFARLMPETSPARLARLAEQARGRMASGAGGVGAAPAYAFAGNGAPQ